ncbi:hypothetical protein [Kribbella sp. NPDC051770]|uniref:hypothetical protein n=1 Tax=Kribbella sp. NPDC051770 TaxID=3155413 RepID=UPI00342591FB
MISLSESDPAGWLEAIATAIVAPGTLLIIFLQVVDRMRQGDDRRRAQAAKVRVSQPSAGGEWTHGNTWEKPVKFTVVNASDDVVSKLQITVVHQVQLPGGVVRTYKPHVWERSRLDPGTDWPVELNLTEERGSRWRGSTASLLFTDAAGNRWRRDAGHNLSSRGRDDRSQPGLVETLAQALREYREARRAG